MKASGIRTQDTPEIVEVPLSSEYLTEAGMYKAGYQWGRHIRSPSAPKNAPELFVRGVEDGYGDGMRIIEEEFDKKFPKKDTHPKDDDDAVKRYWGDD